ncbi:hypothetical protein BDB00DRAFT_848229 [Zychaea mexicana]|uniref:uncharacterized protein n=1 Tax=Zychaea mexicana TaxID=64656 RepID=UPI0022FF34B5|nr:uncharacterized protein BDB00DRAFT_848229 [Zychaea mexicana]KAI9488384.1 hypothetical protein BDB00DRAFT_848229 [Zychaea mexicana]
MPRRLTTTIACSLLCLRRGYSTATVAAATRTAAETVIPTLRNYQHECIESCLNQLKQGHRKQIVSLPVGSGKTVMTEL